MIAAPQPSSPSHGAFRVNAKSNLHAFRNALPFRRPMAELIWNGFNRFLCLGGGDRRVDCIRPDGSRHDGQVSSPELIARSREQNRKVASTHSPRWRGLHSKDRSSQLSARDCRVHGRSAPSSVGPVFLPELRADECLLVTEGLAEPQPKDSNPLNRRTRRSQRRS